MDRFTTAQPGRCAAVCIGLVVAHVAHAVDVAGPTRADRCAGFCRVAAGAVAVAAYLARWVLAAQAGNPDARIYLYETWHRLDDRQGWLQRIDGDLERLWLRRLLYPAVRQAGPIRLIPGGQVMAAAVRAIEAGQVPGLSRREDLFAQDAEGRADPIHFNDIGAWLMALTHFAVLYHRSPAGLPHRLLRADGQSAVPPPDAAAAVLQEVVWRTVSRYPDTGLLAAMM